MAYNPYGGHPYGLPPNYNPYAGATPVPGMGHPGLGSPPGMSPAPGMAPPPGLHQHQPPSATQANRPSGLPPSFQPPPNLPNINFNAPVIRLGGGMGGGVGVGVGMGGPHAGPGASSLPARPNLPPAHHGGYGGGGRRDPDTPLSAASSSGGGPPMRPDRFDRFDRGMGGDRGGDRSGGGGGGGSGLEAARAAAVRDNLHAHVPVSNDDKLRTIFVHKVPDGVGGEAGLERILGLVGRLRWWECAKSRLSDHKDTLFAFATYDDVDSLASAIELLRDVEVPLKKQKPRSSDAAPKAAAAAAANSADKDEKMKDGDGDGDGDGDKGDDHQTADDADDPYKGIEKVRLQVAYDPVSLRYIEAFEETQSDEAKADAKARREASRAALKAAIDALFFPPAARDAANGDTHMADAGAGAGGASGDGIEVVNIPLAQEDELADVPAEMREMVASEIASFRDRSAQRDRERLQREQEMEELERRRNGEEGPSHNGRFGRLEDPAGGAAPLAASSNNVSLGARGGPSSSASRGGMAFVNGGTNGERHRGTREDDPDTEASDEELYRREQRKQQAEDDKQYQEAERKWANRERQRAAALERERERERAEAENAARYRAEEEERLRTWDDEREASRKTHLYYRDHAAWLRKRAHDRAEEEARDAADRRAEQDEQRKQDAEMATARGMADSFLEQQAQELGEARRRANTAAAAATAEAAAAEAATAAAAAAPQRVTISFGAAAQRAQAQRGGPGRRTVAEVEGLLDDEEQESGTKRQLVPIKFEPMSATARMSDAEINQAVRALAQEIPTDRDGLWAWPVQWAHMDDAVVRDKLRPFVEKKVVEYLGVQEQFLVEVVEEHLRKHGRPEALVEELQEALDEAAEDLVKKLWRMLIFFTESEKRGLPA